jgi:hypothetical protein
MWWKAEDHKMGGQTPSSNPLIMALIDSGEQSLHNLNISPKTSPPNTIVLRIKFSMGELWRTHSDHSSLLTDPTSNWLF